MIDIFIDEENFDKDTNFWVYQVDKLKEKWGTEDELELTEKAEEILGKHGIEVIDDDVYDSLSDEEKEEEEREFLEILYNEFENFMIEHISYVLQKSLNVVDDSYFFVCFNLIGRKYDEMTPFNKLHKWKNDATAHKWIILDTIKIIEDYFKDYLLDDNYKMYIENIFYYKKQWKDIMKFFLDSIINRIEEYREGLKYELYS